MIDFHNHVLPNADDGPKEMKVSLDMLRCASDQGITEIVQTIHYQHPKMEEKNTDYNYLQNKIQQLQENIDKENLGITMHLSAEVFYLPNLLKIKSNPLLTLGNNKYMLIEFSTNIFPQFYEQQFFELQSAGITPIIAHPERYRFIQSDISILDSWIERGYVIQIDAGSFIGNFGNKTQNFVFKMIENGYIHIIGSDAHNNKKRNFCIKEVYDFLSDKYSLDSVNHLKKNVINILKGKRVDNILFKKKKENKGKIVYNLIKKVSKLLK
mgnify:CR=1 FL=1